MSLWYSSKGKSYAGKGYTSWLQRYTEHLVSELEKAFLQRFQKHAQGQEYIHQADVIPLGENRYVGTVLEETEQRSLVLEEAMEQEQMIRAEADAALQTGLQTEVELRCAETEELKGKTNTLRTDVDEVTGQLNDYIDRTDNKIQLLEKRIADEEESRFADTGNLYKIIDTELTTWGEEKESLQTAISALEQRVAALEATGGADE